jgi:hypothetical protein
VRVPAEVLGHDSPPRDALQDFASLLLAEPACPGMTPDIRPAVDGLSPPTPTMHAHPTSNDSMTPQRRCDV